MNKNKKNKIIAIIIAVVVAIVGIVATILLINNNNENGGDGSGARTLGGNITSFSFGKSYGMGGEVEYLLSRQGNKAHYKRNTFGALSEKDGNVEKTVDLKYLDELARIIRDDGIVEWDGFDESDGAILDGGGFSLKVEYDDGKSINAHGYMKYPDDYEAVKNELDSFFKRLEEES